MKQLGGDSIAKVFFPEGMALQGSSRSQADRGVPACPERKLCPGATAQLPT